MINPDCPSLFFSISLKLEEYVIHVCEVVYNKGREILRLGILREGGGYSQDINVYCLLS